MWIVGSTALFLHLARSADRVEVWRRRWLAVAALAAGVGVRAAHFIAMIAYDGPMPLRFDPQLTAQSVMFAILFFWLAFHAAGRSFQPVASLLTGLATMALAAVHYDWAAINPCLRRSRSQASSRFALWPCRQPS